jgi:hypothetical protein
MVADNNTTHTAHSVWIPPTKKVINWPSQLGPGSGEEEALRNAAPKGGHALGMDFLSGAQNLAA